MASSPDRFGQLRSILQQPASTTVWAALCAELALWGSEALEHEALPYAASILDRWPVEIERVADAEALRRWEWRGELGAACRLATRLPVRSPEQLERVLAATGIARLRGVEVVGGCTREQGERYAVLMAQLELELLEINLSAEADEAREPSGLLERVRMPSLRRLRVYTLGVGGDLCAVAIAQNPSMTGLVELSLGSFSSDMEQRTCRAGLDGLKVLMGSACFEGLRVLGLYNCPIGPEGARLLAARVRAAPWEVLDLSDCGLGDEGALALAASANMVGLRELILSYSGLTDVGALALARSPYMARLRRLGLRGDELTEEGALALVHSETLGELERLELPGAEYMSEISGEFVRRVEPSRLHVVQLDQWSVDVEMAQRLATSWPPRLKMWSLNSWGLGPGAARYAARWPQLEQLEKLGVSGPRGDGDDDGSWELLKSPYLTGLREMTVYGARQACQHIAANAALGGLRRLTLVEVTDDALRALASSALSELESLKLQYFLCRAAALEALMSSQRLVGLHTLMISSCAQDVACARAIAARTGLPALRSLSFDEWVEPSFVEALVDGEGLRGVTRLWVNRMSDGMAEVFADSPFAGALCHVDEETGWRALSFGEQDPLTLAGLKALLEHPGMEGLEALSLSQMQLGDGLIALLDHPHLDQLRSLSAQACALTPAFTAQLARSAHMNRLEQLNLGGNSDDPAFAAPFEGTRLAWR